MTANGESATSLLVLFQKKNDDVGFGAAACASTSGRSRSMARSLGTWRKTRGATSRSSALSETLVP